jgi:hypothetical protein
MDVSDLSRGAPDDPVDAGHRPFDAGLAERTNGELERGSDAAQPDTPETLDASDAQARPPTVCDSVHAFCEDFNGGSVPGAFDLLEQFQGSVTLDTTTFASAPFSASGKTTALAAADGVAQASLLKNFPAGTGHYAFGLAVRIDPSCFAGDPDPVGVVSLLLGKYYYDVRLKVTSSGAAALVEAGLTDSGFTTVSHDLDRPVPIGAWSRIFLDVSFSVLPSPVRVDVDGVPALYGTLTGGPGRATSPTLTVGAILANEAGKSPGCEVDVDDVVFDEE